MTLVETDPSDSQAFPIWPAQQDALSRAGQLLADGGLVVMPTETVYGLAADALNPQAVARIFETKARPSFDPLIVHVATVAAARSLTTHWPDAAKKLAQAFWPGPLTLVLPKACCVPDLVTSGLPSVAIRVPAHLVARQLIEKADRPLAAPSANRFGSISPTYAQAAQTELGPYLTKKDAILDGGPCETGVESTVVSLVDETKPTLLRPGGVTVEAIEQVLGFKLAYPDQQAEPESGLASPGMLERHYAPTTPLVLLDQKDQLPNVLKPGQAILTLADDLTQAAAQLFAELRSLDEDPQITQILSVRVPPIGLGLAINDRLQRASTKS